MSNTLQEIATYLEKYKKIMITGHEHPDGDSIGSILALGLTLKKLGKEVYLIDWGNSDKFHFLPDCGMIKPSSDVSVNPEVVVFLDCSDKARVPKDFDKFKLEGLPVINIDHHISNNYFGDYNFVDPKAAATGEIIYRLIQYFNSPLDKDVATCIYTALVTDTGSFRYSNTTELTHRIAADLISKGVDVGLINTMIFDEVSIDSFKVLQEGLNNFELATNGKIAWISLSREKLQHLGAKDEHTEALINYTRMLKGVEIGLLFRELEDNVVKVGFRAKGEVDVNKLAQKFGGGGHAKAAGCKIEGSLSQVKQKVLGEAKKIFE